MMKHVKKIIFIFTFAFLCIWLKSYFGNNDMHSFKEVNDIVLEVLSQNEMAREVFNISDPKEGAVEVSKINFGNFFEFDESVFDIIRIKEEIS